MAIVRIKMGVFTFEMPDELTPEMRGDLARMERAVRTLNQFADIGVDGDASNFADAVDAMERLASLAVRTRASRHNRED